jgi:hypothetical protein
LNPGGGGCFNHTLCVIEISEYCVLLTCSTLQFFSFGQKTGNSDLLMGTFPPLFKPSPARLYLLTKTENNYPFTLAYQNREQLPIYTGLPKPRTITRLHLLTKTKNNYPFVRVIVLGFHQHYPFKRVIKTGNNYRPCGV